MWRNLLKIVYIIIESKCLFRQVLIPLKVRCLIIDFCKYYFIHGFRQIYSKFISVIQKFIFDFY